MEGRVVVTSDAGFYRGRANWAWSFRSKRGKASCIGCDLAVSTEHAELIGITRGVEAASRMDPWEEYLIRCDSTSALGMLLHMPKTSVSVNSHPLFHRRLGRRQTAVRDMEFDQAVKLRHLAGDAQIVLEVVLEGFNGARHRHIEILDRLAHEARHVYRHHPHPRR